MRQKLKALLDHKMYDSVMITVGYGDIFATSDTGRLITMISAFMGIAIVALPAGIITAGYMDELNDRDK